MEEINILKVDYTLKYRSLDIYVAGCNAQPKCQGCHNPNSWDFNQGRKYTRRLFSEEIASKVMEFDKMVDHIMVFGGEPMDQPLGALVSMLKDLNTLTKYVWLFTRYDISEIPEQVVKQCDYIKTGAYIKDLSTENNIQHGIPLATSNQKIHKINKFRKLL